MPNQVSKRTVCVLTMCADSGCIFVAPVAINSAHTQMNKHYDIIHSTDILRIILLLLLSFYFYSKIKNEFLLAEENVPNLVGELFM